LRGTEAGKLIQNSGDELGVGTPCTPSREKRQELLRGDDVGKLLQNSGYFEAVEEMRERKLEDPKYAEQCRRVVATMKEKADVAREVKRRCHPNVANVAVHLEWNDRR